VTRPFRFGLVEFGGTPWLAAHLDDVAPVVAALAGR
jgi:hypothetical protein